MQRILKKIAKWLSISMGACLLSILLFLQLLIFFSSDLPDYQELAKYDPPGITRLYANNSEVIAEYALERRIYVSISDIPTIVINAFLAAEDKNFFYHQGVDLYSTFRATVQSLFNLATSKRVIGGSTITQQVVKDFLLSNERSITRKIKEAILAYRISKIYSKQKILELYLNQIFLGHHSYGVAAAAQNYFGKDLEDLSVAEAAMLAALPKAPSKLNPFVNYKRAKARRDWVIERMATEKMITDKEAAGYIKQDIKLLAKAPSVPYGETFYTETVRQELLQAFGEDDVYKKGFIVNTNLDMRLQKIADSCFKKGLVSYDRKHGWRGPLGNMEKKNLNNWKQELAASPLSAANNEYELAVVLKVTDQKATIGTLKFDKGVISLTNLAWARKNLKNQTLGPAVKSAQSVLKVGDIIWVSKAKATGSTLEYNLEQVPEVDGGMVVMEPYTGKVLAMVGGYNFSRSAFNRATQAERQPGSAFKTFIYLAAMEANIAPNDILLDEPLTVPQGRGLPNWSPKNYGENFLGPVTVRTALEKSRNIPTVRLMLSLGVEKILDVANRLGIYHQQKATYSMALGTLETTLLNITNAYNIIASNGLATTPRFIESIYDRRGKLLSATDNIICSDCEIDLVEAIYSENAGYDLPKLDYQADAVIDPASNYQLISLLEGAVKRGTAAKALHLHKTIAGKTGTTNNSFDGWFIGFTPYITVGLYVGFDQPKTLGAKETGSSISLPIFIDFMQEACNNLPDIKFSIPNNIVLQAVHRQTGEFINEDNQDDFPKSQIIVEAFKREPTTAARNRLQQQVPQRIHNNNVAQYNLEEILSLIESEAEETDGN